MQQVPPRAADLVGSTLKVLFQVGSGTSWYEGKVSIACEEEGEHNYPDNDPFGRTGGVLANSVLLYYEQDGTSQWFPLVDSLFVRQGTAATAPLEPGSWACVGVGG